MKRKEILECLCYYDARNPDNTLDLYDDDQIEALRISCSCDNCHKGKTRLAEELLKYIK